MKNILNEKYLHDLVISSLNKLIKEDEEKEFVDYYDEITNGELEGVNYKNNGEYIEIIINETGDSESFYTIKCHAEIFEISEGDDGDYNNAPTEPEYECNLEIYSVIFTDEFTEHVITDEIDCDELKDWVSSIIDWSRVENIHWIDDVEFDL